MKTNVLLALLVLWVSVLHAQSISPGQIYGAAGNGTANSVLVNWSLGQIGPLDAVTTNPNPGNLQLLAPLYNCQTGAFTFQTTGGNGTPIDYYAVTGITDWTTNPAQYVDQELRTAADAQPITLRARQSGQEVSYLWNIRAVCPVGARTAAPVEPSVRSLSTRSTVPVSESATVFAAGGSGKAGNYVLDWILGNRITDWIKAPTGPVAALISMTPNPVAGLTTFTGSPSEAVPYVVSGQHFSLPTATLQVTAPLGLEVSQQPAGPFTAQLNLNIPVAADSTFQQTLYVRLAASTQPGGVSANLVHSFNQGAVSATLHVIGQVKPITKAYTATLAPHPLVPFSTVVGTPSAVQSYTFTGENFDLATAGVHVKAPAGYAVSQQSGGPFTSSLNVYAKVVNGKFRYTIYVRLTGETTGPFTGFVDNILLDKFGSATQPVAGVVFPPTHTLTLNPVSLTSMSATVGTSLPGTPVTLSGTGFSPIFTYSGVVKAPSGYELSPSSMGPFSPTINLFVKGNAAGQINRTLYLRMKTTAFGSYSGNVIVDFPGLKLAAVLPVSGQVHASVPLLTVDPIGQSPLENQQNEATPAQLQTEPPAGLQARVYPNPVDDEFLLRLTGVANQRVQVLLTDLNGQPMLSRTEQVSSEHHELRLRLGDRPTGIYLLTLVYNRQVFSLRILKR